MFKRVLLVLLLSGAACTWAQTAAIQGFCDLGGTPAKTSGLNSTNNLQGIIPSCTVTVYLTGTTTLATIYGNTSGSPLSNPFTASATGSVAPGQWIFWAAVNQGYDVVMSGGLSPNTYPQPVTLTDVYPGFSFTGSGISLQTNGTDNASQTILNHVNSTDCTWTNPSGGEEQVSCDLNGALQMAVVPPVTGQYVVLYPTASAITQTGAFGSGTISDTSGQFQWSCTGITCDLSSGWIANWSGFTLPSGINPANVTAVYADVSSGTAPIHGAYPSGGDANLSVVCSGASNNLLSIGPMAELTALTTLTGTQIATASCTIHVGPSNAGASGARVNAGAVRLIVYYTGTPVDTGNSLGIVPPLYINTATNTMGIDTTYPFPGSYLNPWTVAKLPITPPVGSLAVISDGATSSDCTTGAGTQVVECEWNGTAWTAFASGGGGAVSSVFGRTGAVTAASGDYTVSQVTGAAPLASPTFTGTVTVPVTGATQCLHVNSSGAVSGTGSDCGAGGAGVASLNTLTGALSITGDSSITVTPSGSSIALHATGGGGGGVSSINGNTGAMTFTGSGVSQSENTFTFSGGGSGAAVDILSSQKDAGTMLRYPGLEYYAATSGVPVTIFTAAGSGYVSNIAFMTSGTTAYQSSVISCSVNGEASPSFSGTVRTLFENAWFATGFEANAFTSINGSGFGEAFSMPIPYSNGITCTLTPSETTTIWVNVTAHSGVTDDWPYTRKLHTSIVDSPTPATVNGVTYTPYSYETLVNYAGANPGRLVGVWLFDDENAGGAGAALEGNIAVYTDGFNATWKANTAFSVGQIIMDPNGNFQTVSTAGTTGATEPTFTSATVSGNATTDGTVTWTASVGTPLNIWRASKPYILGMSFLDPNGNVQTVTTAGTTSGTQPTYCTTAGCTTTDGTVTTTTSLAATMVKAAFVSTGTEDFFNLGFYGAGAGTNSQAGQDMWGMTLNANNRRGFYRFFLNDPIRFNNSIGIIRQIGDPSEVSLTVNTLQMAATYFYTQDTN